MQKENLYHKTVIWVVIFSLTKTFPLNNPYYPLIVESKTGTRTRD